MQAYISPYANPNPGGIFFFEIMCLKKTFAVGKVFHR